MLKIEKLRDTYILNPLSRTATHGLECKVVAAKYNYEKTNGFGGPSGEDAPFCTNGFIAIGKLCMAYPVETAENVKEAQAVCAGKTGKLYAPSDKVQHTIVSHMMKEWVSVANF